MFGFLQGLFGKSGRTAAYVDARGEELPAREGSATAAASSHETREEELASAFICREALLGRDQRIIGYEFSHPRELQSRIAEKRVLVRQFYDNALLTHLTGLHLDSFLGARFAFLEISPTSLAHPALLRLPRENVVVILNVAEDTGTLGAEENLALANLSARGTRLGLKWRRQWRDQEKAWLARFPGIAFILMNWPDYAGNDDAKGEFIAWQIAALRRAAGEMGGQLRLIASHLQTPDEFRLCYRLGFDFFRGPFINSREPGKVIKSAINRLRVLELLRDLRREADTRILTQALRQDPVLSYRLLRYANSPALGMTREITSLDQAVTILGRDNLSRWLSLLLFSAVEPGYYEWALTEQALARAALMERLGKKTGMRDKGAAERLFLTGLFSLLDRLMGEPLTELAAKIQVPEEIREALIHRKGVLAQYLLLAESCEQQSPEAIARHAEALGLSAHQVNLALFDALAWAHEMSTLAND
ncbi:MAG: HDOD domain-containing protein [Zoogloeaceae bacterium]|jgi:EAL and modified HD-GYP domain-containing signal transduction protein|nr:HDOD domain-containing protein [Zoogloeaceae bacterium]